MTHGRTGIVVRPGVHHDGSELYLPTRTPDLGDLVPVRIRVPADSGIDRVMLRVLRDAEPSWVQAIADGTDPMTGDGGRDADRFFVAEIPVHNPVTSYRLLVRGPDRSSSWCNGSGEYFRDVTDQHDFRMTVFDPGPAWATDAVVYQVFPDRYASSGPKALPDWAVPAAWSDPVINAGPQTSLQVFGGDLDGITAHLDHIVGLGATTVYLTPIFPARSNHRYNATSFDRVDPLLGGDAALVRLAAEVHRRGLHLIGDLTSNHSGDDHDWFRAARNNPDSAERGYYYLGEDGSYVSWLGYPSLPKLNMASAPLREAMFGTGDSVLARWLRPPYDLDGWRIDVANMTGRNGPHDDTAAVARQIRGTIDAVRPGSVLIAEHCHDASGDLTGDGWQGTMNYSGFTRPVWSWLTARDNGLDSFMGVPDAVSDRPGDQIVATMRDFAASVPWKVAARQWNLLSSHDTPRFATVTRDDAMVRVGAGLLFTYPGAPMVFAGDEIGLPGPDGEGSRTPFPWDRPDGWNREILHTYRTLARLRSDHAALRRGGLRWLFAAADAIGFLRETAEERLLVVAARRRWSGAGLPTRLATDRPQTLYGDLDLALDADGIWVSGVGPGVGVWRLG
jgi:alpha-glucosidase